MTQIYMLLHRIHPNLPYIYFGIFSVGVLLPAIYCAVKNVPFSLAYVWQRAKANDFFAKIVVGVYAAFILITIGCFLLVLKGN
jgi:hypothetical protein